MWMHMMHKDLFLESVLIEGARGEMCLSPGHRCHLTHVKTPAPIIFPHQWWPDVPSRAEQCCGTSRHRSISRQASHGTANFVFPSPENRYFVNQWTVGGHRLLGWHSAATLATLSSFLIGWFGKIAFNTAFFSSLRHRKTLIWTRLPKTKGCKEGKRELHGCSHMPHVSTSQSGNITEGFPTVRRE